jgi:hypothetical protein
VDGATKETDSRTNMTKNNLTMNVGTLYVGVEMILSHHRTGGEGIDSFYCISASIPDGGAGLYAILQIMTN